MSATKLMSAYIELTVKKAGNAMKEITAEVTDIGKQADKVGRQAGESIGGGIAKGAKAGGRAVQEELSKSEAAAEDAGQKAGDALEKGITKSAKKAGRSVQDEIGKATKKASDDAVITPKVDTRSARETMIRDIGGGILDAARTGAKDAGVDLDKWAVEQAGKLGSKLGDAIGDTGLRDLLNPIVEEGHQAADAWGKFRDTMLKIDSKKLDPLAGTLRGIAGTDLHPVATNMLDIVSSLNKSPDAASKAGGLASALAKVGGTAGQLAAAAAAAAWKGIVDLSGDIAKIPGVPGAVDWIQKAPAAAGKFVHDHLNLPSFHVDPELSKPGGMFGPPAGTPAPAPAVVPPMSQADQDKLRRLLVPVPGNATGGIAGITGAGKIFGPGTGTSDSILGVGANGVPTARVSVGEGIIRKAAMDAGGDKIVAALNSGWIPRFDEGTGPGGVPVPLPPGGIPGGEGGLQIDSVRVRRLLSQQFPQLGSIGGWRPPDGYNEHSSGQALDVMIPGWNTPEGKALGDNISQFVLQNGPALGVDYTIWQHGQHNPDGSFQMYGDRGSPTQNHMDHVHIHTVPSGMPGKDQQYFLPPQVQAMLAGGNPALAMAGQSGTGQQSGTGLPAGPLRTQGFIPAGAGSSGKAGTSFMSGVYQMGASAINGLIDQAASAAESTIAMGAMAGSFGAGGQAAGAASQFAIGMVTQAAKRGIQYGAQMAGIGTDALAEILMPFGVPRLFNTDPTQFVPQLPGMPAAVTTGEKAQQAAQGNSQAQPGGPVQPNQMPGQQPVGAPVQMAQPTGITPTPAPIAPLAGTKPPGPVAPIPGMNEATQGIAPSAPASSGNFLDTWLPNLLGHRDGGVVSVYDNGGWLQPGGTAINLSNRPEPILNSQQWADVREIAGRPAPIPDPKAVGGNNDYSMHFGEGSITVKDVEELRRELDSRQRLNSMRHRGRP